MPEMFLFIRIWQRGINNLKFAVTFRVVYRGQLFYVHPVQQTHRHGFITDRAHTHIQQKKNRHTCGACCLGLVLLPSRDWHLICQFCRALAYILGVHTDTKILREQKRQTDKHRGEKGPSQVQASWCVGLSESGAVWEPHQGQGWPIHDVTFDMSSSVAKDVCFV